MNIGSIAYYKATIKESIMINYSVSKVIPLASVRENIEIEINHSTSLQAEEKEKYLQNLENAYKQIRAEIFGVVDY